MNQLANCPVCTAPVHGEQIVLRRTVQRGALRLECAFETCPSCQHVFLNPQPSADELATFYDADYHVFASAPASGDWVAALVRDRFDGVRLNHAQVVPGGTYLDVGCGLGDMVAAAEAVGMRAMGVDLSPIAVDIGRRFGRDLRRGALAEHAFADEAFDSISMYHSLEHMPEPQLIVRECARILKPGATLMVAVPNFGSLSHRVFGGDWRHLDPPYHLQQFVSQSLRQVGEAAGLVLRELKSESFAAHVEDEFALWARRHLLIPQRLSLRLHVFAPAAKLLCRRAESEDRGDALIAHFEKPIAPRRQVPTGAATSRTSSLQTTTPSGAR